MEMKFTNLLSSLGTSLFMAIIKNVPLSINKRLSKISANEEIFDAAVLLYQTELDKNEYGI